MVATQRMTLLGKVYEVNQVIPVDVWAAVPPRNRDALLAIKRVDVSLDAEPPPKRRGRKRKHK